MLIVAFTWATCRDNFSIFKIVKGSTNHIDPIYQKMILRNVENHFICSFQEFAPFCTALYFISSYKDFLSSPISHS